MSRIRRAALDSPRTWTPRSPIPVNSRLCFFSTTLRSISHAPPVAPKAFLYSLKLAPVESPHYSLVRKSIQVHQGPAALGQVSAGPAAGDISARQVAAIDRAWFHVRKLS